jgi:hypothetical protein
VRAGGDDRALDLAALVDPRGAGHLAIAVEREPGAEHRRIEGAAAARQDRGDAGAHLPAIGEILDQGDLADGDAGDIGDRIEWAG